MISVLSLQGLKNATAVAVVTPMIILGVPITDTFLAIIRRTLSGQKFYKPDRNHLHHRLLSLGLTHRGTVLVIYGISMIFSLISLLLNISSRIGGVLLVIGLLFGVELLAELIGVLGPHHSPLLNVLRYIGNSSYREEVRQKRKEKTKGNAMSTLEIKDLHVEIEGKEILKGVNLTLKTGEIAAIMGPNGTGKSTLSAAIMGNPNYEVTKGEILFDGVNILELEVDERARMGLFLAMQYPSEIPGITNAEFLRAAMNAGKEEDEKISIRDFIKKLDEKMELLNMKEEMAERYLNEGFSGGEKKRNEILQLLMLEPTFALLDEIDSGLDIDALKVVSKGVNAMRGEGFGAMIITHYQRLLNYITPDVVHVMMEGRVVLSGGPELAARLEREGYAQLAEELGYDYKEEL